MSNIKIAEGRIEIQMKYKNVVYGLSLELKDFPKREALVREMRALLFALMETLREKHYFAKTFMMDSCEHKVGDPDCCSLFGKPCNIITNVAVFGGLGTVGAYDRCDGILHYQPVYGGYYYECDKCGRTK